LWCIDFNARFPAWIFASSFCGFNLPAELISHAMETNNNIDIDNNDKNDNDKNDNNNNKDNNNNNNNNKISKSASTRLEKCTNVKASFSRSTIELPRYHQVRGRSIHYVKSTSFSDKSAGKNNQISNIKHSSNKIPYFPNNDEKSNSIYINKFKDDIERLCLSASIQIQQNDNLTTPKRILNMETIAIALDSYKELMEKSSLEAHLLTSNNNSSKSNNNSSKINIQMCISVKTQPNRDILQCAKNKGNYIICIYEL
jgi:hypothetical protein